MTTELVPVEPKPSPPAPRPGADLVAAWEGGKKASTVEGYRKDLRDFARFLEADTPGLAVERLLSLGAGDANGLVLDYRDDQSSRGLSSATISRRLAALRSVVKLAQTLGRTTWTIKIASPPGERRRDMRGPTAVELKRVKMSMRSTGSGPAAKRDRAILSLLYGLGLRRAEVVGLDLSDVHFDSRKIDVLGKGRREKVALELAPEVARDVGDWVLLRGSNDGPLFHRLDHPGRKERMNLGSINRLIDRAGKASGLAGKLRPHGLRHAAITGLFARKKTVPQVMAFARHRNPQTTMAYHDTLADDGAEMARTAAKDLE